MRLPEGPNQTPKSIFNPLSEDFVATRADDTNVSHTYCIQSFCVATFPTYLADHIAKKLAHEVVSTRGISQNSNYEDDIASVLKEIEIV